MGYSPPPYGRLYELYYAGSLANGATFTPSSKGLYSATLMYGTSEAVFGLEAEFYHSGQATWYKATSKASANPSYGWHYVTIMLSDGTNARFVNNYGQTCTIVVMRCIG